MAVEREIFTVNDIAMIDKRRKLGLAANRYFAQQ